MSGGADGGPGREDRRRTGLLIASIPAALFLLSAVFIAVHPPDRPTACRHEHPAEQVRAWWEEAVRNDVSVPGTRYVALGEPDDGGPVCLRVGLEEPSAQTHLERRFHRLGIPRDVVIYEPSSAGGTVGGAPGAGDSGRTGRP